MKHELKLIVLIGLVAAIAGCESSRPKPGFVAKEWSDNTRKLGITPVFPPREKVYPGDVYITTVFDQEVIDDGPERIYTVSPYRYDHIDLDSEFKKESLDDRKMPALADYKVGASISKTWEMPPHNIKDGGRLNGLVAFPGFTFASISEADLGFNITNGAWGGLFGGGRNSKYMISYSVPAAEYVSLELKPMMEKVRLYRSKLTASQLRDIYDLAKNLQGTYEKDPIPNIAIVIPAEVYYARSIEVTITSADAFSAQASAVTMAMVELSQKKQKLQDQLLALEGMAPDKPKQGQAQDTQGDGSQSQTGSQTPQKPTDTTGQGTKTTTSDGDINNKNEKAALLEKQISSIHDEIVQLSKSVIPNAPGVTGSVSRSSTNGVTLTQDFYYPIAVGFKGLTYRLADFINLNKSATLVGDNPALLTREEQADFDAGGLRGCR